MSGGPLQFQEKHPVIAHATRAAKDRFDRGVQRLDDAEADRMIAVGSNALQVIREGGAELLHLRQSLPAQGVQPAEEKACHAPARGVRPEPIELLPQDIRFEETPIHREPLLEVAPFGSADRFPAPQQQPPFGIDSAAGDIAEDPSHPAPMIRSCASVDNAFHPSRSWRYFCTMTQAWLGFTTKQTRVVWLTEERPTTFLPGLRKRPRRLDGRHRAVVLGCLGRPWPAIVDLAVAEAAARDAGVLIIDTLAQFAGLRGDEENNAGAALRALAPVQRAAGTGLAVELTRHERKSGGEPGESARGSSAYGGAADIIVAYQKPEVNTRRTGASCAHSAGSPKPLRPWSSKSFLPI